jgi:hypothetical protein
MSTEPTLHDPVISHDPAKKICGAKKRGRNEICHSRPMANGRCRLHGGLTPSGTASAAYRGKNRSKYLTALPARLQPAYELARKAEDLLELNNEIALVDTRINDVLSRVDSGEAGTIWERLSEVCGRFDSAMTEKDFTGPQLLFVEMATLIKKGGEDWEVWGEIGKLLEQRRKLVESETKRITQQQEVLTSSEAYLLFNALLSIVNEHVTDRETKAKIQQGFTRLTVGARDLKRIAS